MRIHRLCLSQLTASWRFPRLPSPQPSHVPCRGYNQLWFSILLILSRLPRFFPTGALPLYQYWELLRIRPVSDIVAFSPILVSCLFQHLAQNTVCSQCTQYTRAELNSLNRTHYSFSSSPCVDGEWWISRHQDWGAIQSSWEPVGLQSQHFPLPHWYTEPLGDRPGFLGSCPALCASPRTSSGGSHENRPTFSPMFCL